MFSGSRSLDSPIIPLSPDPFGRYPSEAEATHLEEERNSQVYTDSSRTLSVASNDRNSTLTIPGAAPNDHRPASQTPSSRFSMDSMNSEETAKASVMANGSIKTSPSLMSVKSIRRLWRRSDGKRQSVSSVVQPESGRTSPNTAAPPPVPNGQPAGRTRSRSTSKAPPPPPDFVPPSLHIPAMPPREVIRGLRFDQESPYPIHPVRPVMRSPSPPPPVPLSRPSSQQANRPPSTTHPFPPMSAPLPGPDKSSARKSILKFRKSGNLSTGSKGSISSTGSRSSTEQQPDMVKKRRPSMLDIAASAMRSSLSLGSASTLNGEIPPSPALPEQYASHARSSSRQSVNTLAGRPSVSSNTSSPPRARSQLMLGSPPRNGLHARQSRPSIDSHESRPSFDSSQFEMVSPPRGSLTYPYNAMDHSVVSQE